MHSRKERCDKNKPRIDKPFRKLNEIPMQLAA